MINEWTPKHIVTTEAGDVEITNEVSLLAYVIAESGVTVILKNGTTQVYSPLVGPDEDDHEDTPLVLSHGITIDNHEASSVTISNNVWDSVHGTPMSTSTNMTPYWSTSQINYTRSGNTPSNAVATV